MRCRARVLRLVMAVMVACSVMAAMATTVVMAVRRAGSAMAVTAVRVPAVSLVAAVAMVVPAGCSWVMAVMVVLAETGSFPAVAAAWAGRPGFGRCSGSLVMGATVVQLPVSVASAEPGVMVVRRGFYR